MCVCACVCVCVRVCARVCVSVCVCARDMRDLARAHRKISVFPNLFSSPHAESSLHAELTRRFLRAGKHVLIEYPLALSLSDAEELFSIAEEKGFH